MKPTSTDYARVTGAPAARPTIDRRPKKKRTRKAPAAEPKRPGLYYPVMTPDEFYENLGKLRKEAEIEIERLIAFVDAIDADADLEPSGDEDDRSGDETEPSLGSLDRCSSQTMWHCGFDRDQEEEHDGSEPEEREGDNDREPEEADQDGLDEPGVVNQRFIENARRVSSGSTRTASAFRTAACTIARPESGCR